MTTRWMPGSTATERARAIANYLLDLLPRDTAHDAVQRAHAVGEKWLGEHPLTFECTDEVTTDEAAVLAGVTVDVIRQWALTPELLPRAGWRGRQRTYLAGHVLTAAATIAARRRGAPS